MRLCFCFFFPRLKKRTERTWLKVGVDCLWELSNTILSHTTANTNLLVVSEAGVAGGREVLQQVNAVIFIISTQPSFQQSLPVIVIPATQKETEA